MAALFTAGGPPNSPSHCAFDILLQEPLMKVLWATVSFSCVPVASPYLLATTVFG